MRLFLSFILIAATLGCSTTDKKIALDETDQLLTVAARKIANDFGADLKKELLGAMNDGGPAMAIAVCATRAPQIAAAHSHGKLITVRRITDRNRNPENLADSVQMEALSAMSSDSSIAELHEWRELGDRRVFCYYKAIKVNQLCIKCHGSIETIDQAVLESLTNNYPGDRAVEYNAGDFRGAFLVEIEWPGGKDYIDSLSGESKSM